jgi:hypothetical protein
VDGTIYIEMQKSRKKRSGRGLGVISREKSFGQRLKFGQAGGNLCLWGPERFFSGVPDPESTYPLFGRAEKI